MARNRHVLLLSGLVMLLLGSCSTRNQFSAVEQARIAMIGLSQEDVIMCSGFPDRTRDEGGSEIWSYEYTERQSGLNVSAPVLFGVANSSVNLSSAGSCRLQVRFVDGRVDRIEYAGDNDGRTGRNTVCTPLVNNCLRYAADTVAERVVATTPQMPAAPAGSDD